MANVVSLPARLTIAQMPAPVDIGTLRNPQGRRFVDAWLTWRGSSLVPRRSQMDLRQITDALPMVVLFEWREADDVRIRLTGTAIDRYTGEDRTGKSYSELTPPSHWPVRRHRLRSMVQHPCGGVMMHEYVASKPVTVTTITLPLLPDEIHGFPYLFSYVVPAEGLPHPADTPLARLSALPEAFSFIDIGAGAPASTEPA
jgi:hypothetical protein